jgi:REP element-mobilizing transposase RayT
MYHVILQAADDGVIYPDDAARLLQLDLFGRCCAKYDWVSFGYCLLSTHGHLLIQTREANVGRGMQWLNGLYGQCINRRLDRRGHVFGARYFTSMLETDGHLLMSIRYVARNAVEAGMCDNLFDWPWSSYPAVVGFGIPRAVDVDAVLGLLASDREIARQLLRDFVESGVSSRATAA